MHRVMPRLMLAQRGSGCPQSQQTLLPAMAITFCSSLSPLRFFSRVSTPESRLPVDADDFFFHLLDVFCSVPESCCDAGLDGFDPGLPELLRVCLHHTTLCWRHNFETESAFDVFAMLDGA